MGVIFPLYSRNPNRIADVEISFSLSKNLALVIFKVLVGFLFKLVCLPQNLSDTFIPCISPLAQMFFSV